MEIGSKVTWKASNKTMQGLFLQEQNGVAEVICFQMGDVNCRLRVFVDYNTLEQVL